MNAPLRRRHLVMWLLIAPVVLASVALAVASRVSGPAPAPPAGVTP